MLSRRFAPVGPGGREIALDAGASRTLTIGLNSTLGVAAAILALGAGASIARNLDASPAAEQTAASVPDSVAKKFPAPPEASRTIAPGHHASTAIKIAAPRKPVAAEIATVAPDEAPSVEAPVVAPPEPLQLMLARTNVPQDRLQFGATSVWGRGQHVVARSGGVKSALRSAASGLVDNWSAPEGSDHEVSLFVSTDDEALSWSLSHGSRNYGGVTYQKDRVDIGNAAAGLAVSIGDAQVAAAYVQRDVGSNFGGHSQDYGGIILTLRH